MDPDVAVRPRALPTSGRICLPACMRRTSSSSTVTRPNSSPVCCTPHTRTHAHRLIRALARIVFLPRRRKLRSEVPESEARIGREREWGSWGGQRARSPTVRGPGIAVSSLGGVRAEPRPPNGFHVF